MHRQLFVMYTAVTLFGAALVACSSTQHAPVQQSSAGTSTPHPGCAGCKAGYVRLTEMTNGGRKFLTPKQDRFEFHQMIGVGQGSGITVAQAAWWTPGGVLQITAARGTLSAGWEALGAHVKVPHPAPPASGTPITAGWYNAILVCRTARCEHVAVTVNGRSVEPYAPPGR